MIADCLFPQIHSTQRLVFLSLYTAYISYDNWLYFDRNRLHGTTDPNRLSIDSTRWMKAS